MMSDNRLTTLRCSTGYLMSRLYEQPPHDPGLSVWVCIDCGSLAIHVESSGDIFWYGAQAKSHTTDESGARASLMGPVFAGPPKTEVHHAGCAYCSARFDCSCDSPGQRHMCPRCDNAAEESKITGEFPPTGTRRSQATKRYIDGGNLNDLREAMDLASEDYAKELGGGG